jgi:hypothetical protein
MSRFENHLKKNLVNLKKNLYISPSDSLYYEKIIRYTDPHSPKAHYKLGQKYERQGFLSKALIHYTEAAHIDSPYYFKAKKSIKILEEKINQNNSIESVQPLSRKPTIPMFVKSIIAFLLLFNLFLLFFLFGIDPLKATVSNVKQWGIGMDVVYESIDVPYVIYFPFDEPIDEIEKTLYHEAVKMGKNMPNQNLLLYGVLTTDRKIFNQVIPLKNEKVKEKAFVIVEYNSSLDDSVKIRFLNAEYNAENNMEFNADDNKAKQSSYPLIFVGTNLVRTAIQSYIKEKGSPPNKVENLVGDYPNNYLSFIPNEVVSGKNQVFNQFNGQGGWVYNREAKEISEMFFPNTPAYSSPSSPIPFNPVEIIVLKDDFSLVVKSDPYVIATKPVGLGKNNSTPEGLFTINDRVLEPIGKKPNIFGMAGLGMGEIAIHGTYDDDSIRNKQSLGCIRLSNKDIMDIFHLIPKGTVVKIEEASSPSTKNMALKSIEKLLPGPIPQIQQTSGILFNWLG